MAVSEKKTSDQLSIACSGKIMDVNGQKFASKSAEISKVKRIAAVIKWFLHFISSVNGLW